MKNGEPITGIQASQEELNWLVRGKEINKESLKILSDESQKMISLGSTLLAAYTGTITLLKIIEKNPSAWWVYLLLAIPIICWAFTIFWAFKASFPKVYIFDADSPTAIRQTINNMITDKYDKLRFCLILFTVSLAISAIAIFGSLYAMIK